jgi:hypothetical protein
MEIGYNWVLNPEFWDMRAIWFRSEAGGLIDLEAANRCANRAHALREGLREIPIFLGD